MRCTVEPARGKHCFKRSRSHFFKLLMTGLNGEECRQHCHSEGSLVAVESTLSRMHTSSSYAFSNSTLGAKCSLEPVQSQDRWNSHLLRSLWGQSQRHSACIYFASLESPPLSTALWTYPSLRQKP